MINPNEFRLGNYLMQKINNRIVVVTCNYSHFELMAKNGKDLFPVVLNPALVEKCGFNENPDYPLLPEAREFRLVLPVNGPHKNEVVIYMKNNKECFGRAMLNDLPASNPFYHLHQLQNLCFALTGAELPVRI